MHLVLLSHSLPQPSSNGGPMTCWAVMEQMLSDGHRVTVVALHYPGHRFQTPEREEEVRSRGVEVRTVPLDESAQPETPAGTLPLGSRPTLARLFPTSSFAAAVRSQLEDLGADAAFVYHWDTLAATHGLRSVPRLAAVDDPWHLPNLRRWQSTRPSPTRSYAAWTLATLRGIRPTTRAMVGLLNEAEASASFQPEAAARLRRQGASGCEFLRAPVPDGGGRDWEARRTDAGNERFRILLGPSNLSSTVTRAGLRYFLAEVLPRVERELGPDGFEVRVVGEREPPELTPLLDRPNVVRTGRVEPADEEFLAADVQVVTTPYALGKRVRIIAGWSFGCCVVAHANEAAGLPELVDGETGLVGADAQAIAGALVRAARDRALRRAIGAGGRQAYERHYAPAAAGREIVGRLEQLARARGR